VLLAAAQGISPAQHAAAVVLQRLLAYLALLNSLGIGIHLVLQILLLHLGLGTQLLIEHPFLLLLLAHHFRLHTLLARNNVALLVRVVQGIQWLCERREWQ